MAAVRSQGFWDWRSRHPLLLTGTVTLLDPRRERIVLQDDTGAIALQTSGSTGGIAVGDRITLRAADSMPATGVLADYPLRPTTREFLPVLESPSKPGLSYVARIRGFLIPPSTGDYRFWIASDDSSELWLATDESPNTARVVANVTTWTKPRDWGHLPGQRSGHISLVAGKRYYFEVLHEQHGGTDHLSVSWEGPGLPQALIEGRYLVPWSGPATSEPGAAAPTRGTALREVWTNVVIPNVAALSAPLPLEQTLLPFHYRIERSGRANLPVPRPQRTGEPISAADDFGWAELEGVVEFVGRTPDAVTLELSNGALRSRVEVLQWQMEAPERLLGRRIKAIGAAEAATDINGARVIGTLWVPSTAQLSISGDWPSPQNYPLVSIASLVIGEQPAPRDRPVRIRGRVVRTDGRALVMTDDGAFVGSVSDDGKTWRRIGPPIEVPMTARAHVGLVVSSRSADKTATAVFDQVQGLASAPTLTAIGDPMPNGELRGSGQRYTLTGSGHDMWMHPDQFHFAHTTLSGDGEIVARLEKFEPREEWAKAGIMIRDNLSPDAPFVDLVQTGTRGCCLQWRAAGDAAAPVSIADARLHPPVWLKLARRHQSITVQCENRVAVSPGSWIEVVGFPEPDSEGIRIAQGSFRVLPIGDDAASPDPEAPRRLVELGRVLTDTTGPQDLGPIRLRGVVTFSGVVQRRRYLALQDHTGAAIVGGWSIPTMPQLRAGQWMEVQCFPASSGSGAGLQGETGVVLGPATMPKPLRHPAEYALPRKGEGYWIEVEAVGRSVSSDGLLIVRADDTPFYVAVAGSTVETLRRLVDARLRIRGVIAYGSDQMRLLLVQDLDQVEVEAEPTTDPFARPLDPINTVAAAASPFKAENRRKVIGTVTYADRTFCYLQDGGNGARIEFAVPTTTQVGERLQVVGFPETSDDRSLVLADAITRPAPGPSAPIPPVSVTVDDLLTGANGAKLVTLRAVISRQRSSDAEQTLELQMENRIFRATLDPANGGAPSMPSGSVVSLTGVCVLESGLPDWIKVSADNRSMLPVRLLLRAGSDIVVLHKPRWWAVKRTLLGGSVVLVVLVIAAGWIHVLRRRVAQRTADLAAAMEKLKQETQTAATLAERNRLAGEIHDSLEQGFSGLILQLDTTAKLASCPPEVRSGLALARSMVAFSRKEIRHAVWDLHSPSLESADLGDALKAIVSQLAHDGLHTTVVVEGPARRLSSATEHHVLRVAQEAIANAVKHAGAHQLDIRLVFDTEKVTLTVRDDGHGFEPSAVLATGVGHFGLRSLRGRAAKVRGGLKIESRPGSGTTVSLQVPIEPIAQRVL